MTDNVIEFPRKTIGFKVPESRLEGVVEVTSDGRVRMSPDVELDDASREFWEAVQEHVLGAWEQTSLPRERMRVRLLTTYLDRIDPQWREKIKVVLGG